MLDQSTRAAILKLQQQEHSIRSIARAMKLSRGAVRNVLRSGSEMVPSLVRPEKATPYRDQILELYARCKGNLVRVHEELVASGAQLSYQALTAFCRRQGIGHEPQRAVGEYHFQPGQEMQHDTSPHRAEIGGQLRLVQTASLVFCYSRMLFFQFFPTFTRFDCKVFLTDALEYFQGGCQTCMIDNTHLVVLKGTGRDMVPVPEMAAFAERYGFCFQAHEKGDANRSAHVERRFSYIENNFLAGRSFQDWEDANRQARAWCDKVNAKFRQPLKASPRELWAFERSYLQPFRSGCRRSIFCTSAW
jgi:transposase